MKRAGPTPEGLAEAAECLKQGRVIVYPTETVYGLGADPFNEDALTLLWEAKGRPAHNPVLLIVADEEQLQGVVSEITPAAQRCIERFWPGPLSLLFPALPNVPGRLLGDGGKVCIRCPGLASARGLCRAFGGAVTSTSANRSGQQPFQSLDNFDLEHVALAVDAGQLPPSPPSTVYDPDTGLILRKGAIPPEDLHRV